MIRRLAQIYGGRSSSLGNLALLRRVFTALLGAGALALADDLIGSVASGGLLGKLSRRFGEGVVNGALTARVGLAAMEACRPLPFAALPKPGTTATISRALAGFLSRAKDQS
jgi:putative membrane protein